jgi:hypothetical protein
LAAARRYPEPAGRDEDAGFRPDENTAQWPSHAQWPPDADGRPARGPGASPGKNRNRALVAGAGVLSAVAIVGVILAPSVLGPSDPGCQAYAGPALTAYNKMIYDLNAQAPQARLSADMAAAVSELTKATADAHAQAVKSALNALLSGLRTVQADVAAGTVPNSALNALNTASAAADKAC